MTTTLSTPERRVANPEDASRSVQSASSSRTRIASSPSRPSNTQLTIESVLQNANGDIPCALEVVLNERNLLSTQNSQLWKLVEKQRHVHSTVSKELERVRAERDKAFAKLQSQHDIRRAKASTFSGSDSPPSRSGTSSPVAERLNGRCTPTPQSHLDIDEVGHSLKPSNSLSTSRSHEPIRLRTDGSTHPATDTLSVVNPISLISRASSPSRAMTDPRFGLFPEAPSAVIEYNRSHLPSVKPGSASQDGTSHSHKQSDDFHSQTAATLISSLSPLTKPAETVLHSKLISSRDRSVPRNSGLVVPEEARRFIASLSDSPINPASLPQLALVSTAKEPLPIGDIPVTSTVSKSLGDDSSTSAPGQTLRAPSPVPQMGHRRTPSDERKADSHPNRVVPERQGTSTPPPVSLPYNTIPLTKTPRPSDRDKTLQPWRQSIRPEPSFSTSISREVNADFTANLFPDDNTSKAQPVAGLIANTNMPKANIIYTSLNNETRAHIHAQRLAAAQAQAQVQAQFPSQMQALKAQPQTQAHNPSRASPQHNGNSHSNEAMLDQHVPECPQNMNILRPAKRMYLVEVDLPRCKIGVVGSHIRPNDRGKEVLSFSIEVSLVEPVSSWKVEKLYSDVLALDSKVRSRLSRGDAKKLAHLPDSKLFRDNAPAKVDQRKTALEFYLQSVLRASVQDADEICDFFSTDLINETNVPVTQMGYKEGYLTKRGKNFGGWKTRYFVLQGPSLEYFESRGGNHLGSINITGAQIGRQQRPANYPQHEDENEFRHAILILEQKKGPPAIQQRHVLCAESDQERDSWVDVLIRYVSGVYDEQGTPPPNSIIPSQNTSILITSQSRPSTSSVASYESTAVTPSRRYPAANVLNTNLQDELKHPQVTPVLDSSSLLHFEHYSSRPEQLIAPDNAPISSSLPTQLNTTSGGVLSQRAASELGHYTDLSGIRQHYQESQKTSHRYDRQQIRVSVHPGSTSLYPHEGRSSSVDVSSNEPSRVKISGPMNGAPIPTGIKFGGGASSATESSNEKERKHKSKGFWGGIMRSHNTTHHHPPRAVFGVYVSEALEIAQIANLPAVAFRCIQYLEAKRAYQEEGIYRLSGSSAVIKNLRDRFNLECDVDLLASNEEWDCNAVAGVLKSFLREIPGGLFTRELQPRFTAVIDLADPQERVDELTQLVSQLPVSNYSLLRALIAHLILIIQNSAINKMTTRNIGIVFCPTLAIPAAVFNLMLTEFDRVFNVDGDTAEEVETDRTAAGDEGLLPSTSKRTLAQNNRNNRNSRSYADGAADQLLGLGGRALQQEESDSADELTIPDSLSDGSETQDPDATAQFSRSNLEITQPSFGEAMESEGDPTGKIPVNRTRNHIKASASRDLHINVYDGTNVVGLPASPHPSFKGFH